MTSRVEWIDSAKGALIILVIIGHAWRGLGPSGIIPSDLYVAVDLRIYAFHMATFFALSGWFFVASLAKISAGAFLTSRLVRLLWPMVLWTYLFLVVKALAGQYSNNPTGLSDVLVAPVPGLFHMWFLWALFLLNIAFMCLKPFIKGGKIPNGVLWAVIVVVTILQAINPSPLVLHWIGPAAHHAPFFLLGTILGQTNWLAATSRRQCVLAAVVFAVLLFLMPRIADYHGVFQIGSIVLTACVLVVFSRLRPSKTLTVLGLASMPIYLSHIIFSAFTREVLFVLGVNSAWVHIGLTSAIGLIAPLILLWLARHTGTVRLLGF